MLSAFSVVALYVGSTSAHGKGHFLAPRESTLRHGEPMNLVSGFVHRFRRYMSSARYGYVDIFPPDAAQRTITCQHVTRHTMASIFSPNGFAWPHALFGSISAGFKTTLANSSYTSAELGYQWKDSEAKVVFTHPVFLPAGVTMLEGSGVCKEEVRKRIIVMGVGDKDVTAKGYIHMDDLLGKGCLSAAERFDGPLSNETLYLCYSSGTTGKPKGVEARSFVSPRNIVSYSNTHHSQRTGISFQTAS